MRNLILAAAIGAVSLGAISSAQAAIAYGVTTQNSLFRFDTATPTVIQSAKFITGLQANEVVVGMDFRPSFVSPGTAATGHAVRGRQFEPALHD